MINFTWVFFRSDDLSSAISYIGGFARDPFSLPMIIPFKVFAFIGILLFVEWVSREREHGLGGLVTVPILMRWGIYLFLIGVILSDGGRSQDFIYFQF